MSKAKNQRYNLDVNFDNFNLVGSVEIIKNTRTGLTDEKMAHMVIAPTIEQSSDGSLKIISWSLIPAALANKGRHGK